MNSAKLLRIYTSENAYSGSTKVFQLVCERAREQAIAGATVLDARLGFGRNAHLRQRHILEDERSVVIEMIDDETRLRGFVAGLTDLPEIPPAPLEIRLASCTSQLKILI
jgi:PII-like signaling protein